MCSQKDTIKDVILKSLKVIRLYDWLLDLYVLDFFVDDHWVKLPLSWQESFQNMTPQDLGNILCGIPINQVLPLSFLSLVKSVEVLSLPRKSKLEKTKKVTDENVDSCSGHPKLKNLFLKHVKLKKRHEISLMADVVSSVASESNCDAVIDFGSGLGHLVRMLAYKNSLYAAGIECQLQLTEEARKLDLELEYTAGKHLSDHTMATLRRPVHLNMTLTTNGQLLHLSLPDTAMKTYGLIGLHPCGDLGPLLIKHFINCEQVKYICVVGCCYMKLTCEGIERGYPLSEYVSGLDSQLSYVSREIACHAIDVYLERLRTDNYDDLKACCSLLSNKLQQDHHDNVLLGSTRSSSAQLSRVNPPNIDPLPTTEVHAYRAALERVLVEHNPKLKHAQVRNIKHSNDMTFQQYSTLALERLNIPVADVVVARGEADLRQWRRVVTLYTLRLALAPLVECVVLLDRALCVLEHGLKCEIHPVFDPKLSPRNHIIVGKRS